MADQNGTDPARAYNDAVQIYLFRRRLITAFREKNAEVRR